MRNKGMLVMFGIFFFMAGAFAQEAKQEVKKDGWWIKVRTQKPESQMIGIYLGASRSSYGLWTLWNPGSPAEFDVSDEYRNSPTLFVMAQSSSGQKSGFCLMYKSKGVRYFEFDLEDSKEVKTTDEDKRCE